ncbi:alpha/beta-hydrolase [Tricholoma matsutake]|nr:alpha/beta-hydrolase [Tricholoma matsutake 945]
MYHWRSLLSAVIFGLLSGSFLPTSAAQFKPADYSKRVATCKAEKRTPEPEVVDINLRYVDINPQADKTLLMVHGWPGLWSTWSNQIQEFENDYHLVVPDLRGFAESQHPGDVQTSGTMGHLVGDMVCILKHANVNSAICMGHDWGSQICYEAARMRPDIFTAVIGAVVPYIPAGDTFLPVQALVGVLPRLTYQLYFNTKLDTAVAELDQDVRRTIRATFRTVDSPPPDEYLKSPDSYLEAWSHVKEIPAIPFLTSEEEDYLVDQYGIQGFRHTLQFYMPKNRYAAWELARAQANSSIPQPALAVYPLNDPVANWQLAARLWKNAEFIPNLTTKTLEGAHWVHLENPTKFNAVVREWLDNLHSEQVKSDAENDTRPTDEL